jgi:hypothetical protein
LKLSIEHGRMHSHSLNFWLTISTRFSLPSIVLAKHSVKVVHGGQQLRVSQSQLLTVSSF